MTKTKLPIGTKVIIANPDDEFHDEIGIITEYANNWAYYVTFQSGHYGYYDDYEVRQRPPQKQRGFIALQDNIELPVRATKGSAGYDICIPMDFTLEPGESRVFDTGLAAYMMDDEVLSIYVRSSVGIKSNVTMANTVSIIDSDYIHSDNGGHIKIALRNNGDKVFSSIKEIPVCQGIFTKYLLCDDDDCTALRNGGIGSSTK